MEILGVPTDQTVYETAADPTPSDIPNSGLKVRRSAGCINLNYLTEVSQNQIFVAHKLLRIDCKAQLARPQPGNQDRSASSLL